MAQREALPATKDDVPRGYTARSELSPPVRYEIRLRTWSMVARRFHGYKSTVGRQRLSGPCWGAVPHVLRPRAKEYDGLFSFAYWPRSVTRGLLCRRDEVRTEYMLVGECYIYGIMEGEVMGRKGLDERLFALRETSHGRERVINFSIYEISIRDELVRQSYGLKLEH